MKKIAYAVLLAAFFAATFFAGSRYGRLGVMETGASRERKIIYYVDPMNPAHTSDSPGTAPCGMPMEPVYAEEERTGAVSAGPEEPLRPGTLRISPEKQQLIGVTVGAVENCSGSLRIRVPGRVAPDENRVYRVKAAVDGWVHEVSDLTTGSRVEKKQFLFSFSTTELFTSAQAFIFALTAMDRLTQTGMESPAEANPTTSNFLQRIERLQSLGMSPAQIEETRKTREIPQSIKVFAPGSGFVLARNVSPDERFEKAAELYRIADLGKVWVLAEVAEYQADRITPGLKARITLPHGNKAFDATVSDILPLFDPANRIFKVRLEVDNPGFVLRPDMVVYVDCSVEIPNSIMIPEEAVLISGHRKTVFVDLGNGLFHSRRVETGSRFGDKVEIVEGLMPGERIVLSGNFLIDSESRMRQAAEMRLEKESSPPSDTGNQKRLNVSGMQHTSAASAF